MGVFSPYTSAKEKTLDETLHFEEEISTAKNLSRMLSSSLEEDLLDFRRVFNTLFHYTWCEYYICIPNLWKTSIESFLPYASHTLNLNVNKPLTNYCYGNKHKWLTQKLVSHLSILFVHI